MWYVMLQFCPLFLGMVIYDNEFEKKENKIWTEDKIEPQHIQCTQHSNKEKLFAAQKYRQFCQKWSNMEIKKMV